MGHKEFSQTMGLYLTALMLVISILHPLNLFAEDKQLEKTFKVEIKDRLVSAELKDADLSEVLKEIENGTDTLISIGKELTGKKITAQFENLDIESALKEILRDNYYVLTFEQDPKNKEKGILKEVKAEGTIIGSKPSKGRITAISIPYGAGANEVGADIVGEGASRGPKSFAVGDKGEIYICDTVNGRVQVFSREGAFLFTIQLREHLPIEEGRKRIYSGSLDDIAVDNSGFIYVYDGMVRKLYQYDKQGIVITAIDVDKRLWGGSGPMHIVNNEIVVYVCDSKTCSDIIIGRILFGNRLVGLAADEPKRYSEEGKAGRSGKRYMTRPAAAGRGRLEIRDSGDNSLKVISLPLSGIESIQFLGEDIKGNFYMESGRFVEKGLREVHKFNVDADYLQSTTLPIGNINFGSAKNYDVDKDGVIYQFLPEEDSLKINVIPSEGNQ
jgi:hypothetical protein